MIKSSPLKKTHLLMVFFACLAYNMIALLRPYEISAVSDGIISFFTASRLAGLDWHTSTSLYYGQVYYALFAPVFLVTDDVLVRHSIIQVINVLVNSSVGVIIYYVAVSYFKADNSPITALIPIIITCFAPFTWSAASTVNEPPVFIVVWLVCLILVSIYNTDITYNKRRVILTLLLVAALCYGQLVHTRLIALVIAIVLAVLIYFLIFRKWFMPPLLFFPAVIIGYLGSEWLKSIQLQTVWDGRSANEVGNATLSVTTDLSNLPSIKGIFDIIINNIFAFTVETFGLAMIFIVFAAFLFYRGIVCIRRRQLNQLCNDIELPENQFFILLVFGICFLGSLLAMITNWGPPIEDAIIRGRPNEYTRGLYMSRYFAPYFGPVVLVMFTYFSKARKIGGSMCLIAIGMFTLFLLYAHYYVTPYAGTNAYVGWFFIQNIGFETTLFTITGLLAIYALFLHMGSGRLFFVLIFSLILVLRLSTISPPFFSFDVPLEEQAAYYTLKGIKEETPLPHVMHTGGGASRIRYQHFFSHNRVLSSGNMGEDYEGDNILVCVSDAAGDFLHLFDAGYILYIAGERALYIRGDDLVIALYNYARVNGTEENIITEWEQIIEEDIFSY